VIHVPKKTQNSKNCGGVPHKNAKNHIKPLEGKYTPRLKQIETKKTGGLMRVCGENLQRGGGKKPKEFQIKKAGGKTVKTIPKKKGVEKYRSQKIKPVKKEKRI